MQQLSTSSAFVRGGGGAGLQTRAAVVARLQARRSEIERGILDRVFAISNPAEVPDFSYPARLRSSVAAALDYALESLELGEPHAPPPPPALLAQARLAARSGVGLDTVLRRYLAGYTLLGEFLDREARHSDLRPGSATAQLAPGRAAIFDRLLAAVSEEYERESRLRPRSTEQRRTARVEQLLGGEPIDTSEFAYDFATRHIGLIALGHGAEKMIRKVASALDYQLLLARGTSGAVWAWLGSRRQDDSAALARYLASRTFEHVTVTVGEPGYGLGGWRLTHRQAAAALPVARRGTDAVVRYADVAILASALRDDLLSTSLRQIILTPLEDDQDGGATAIDTLRAYIAAEGNVSSAAVTLGVNRNTVSNRLRAIEQAMGRRVHVCAAEIDTALRLAELSDPQPGIET